MIRTPLTINRIGPLVARILALLNSHGARLGADSPGMRDCQICINRPALRRASMAGNIFPRRISGNGNKPNLSEMLGAGKI